MSSSEVDFGAIIVVLFLVSVGLGLLCECDERFDRENRRNRK